MISVRSTAPAARRPAPHIGSRGGLYMIRRGISMAEMAGRTTVCEPHPGYRCRSIRATGRETCAKIALWLKGLGASSRRGSRAGHPHRADPGGVAAYFSRPADFNTGCWLRFFAMIEPVTLEEQSVGLHKLLHDFAFHFFGAEGLENLRGRHWAFISLVGPTWGF